MNLLSYAVIQEISLDGPVIILYVIFRYCRKPVKEVVRCIRRNFKLKIQVSLSNIKTVQKFYSTLLSEVEQAGYNSQEISLLGNTRRYYGRYLNPSLRNYFIQTVIPHIADAISYFRLMERPNLNILDLGCGLGIQSLIFASFGAKVVGVDIREEAISLCKKRKAYYEKELKVDLDLEFHHCDFRLSHQRYFNIRFDCLFSMSAFSYITPLEKTVKLISYLLKDDAKIFLYEENATFLVSYFKRREIIPSPKTTANAFRKEKFDTDFLYGGCSLPSFFWRIQFLNRLFMLPLNNLLRKRLYLSFNYILGMKRGSV